MTGMPRWTLMRPRRWGCRCRWEPLPSKQLKGFVLSSPYEPRTSQQIAHGQSTSLSGPPGFFWEQFGLGSGGGGQPFKWGPYGVLWPFASLFHRYALLASACIVPYSRFQAGRTRCIKKRRLHIYLTAAQIILSISPPAALASFQIFTSTICPKSWGIESCDTFILLDGVKIYL